MLAACVRTRVRIRARVYVAKTVQEESPRQCAELSLASLKSFSQMKKPVTKDNRFFALHIVCCICAK